MVKLVCSRYAAFLCSQKYLNWHLRNFILSTNHHSSDANQSNLVFPMSKQKLINSKIIELYKLSRNVQGLKLLVEDQEFSFKAGQWVDFFVPRLTQIAGYSICSSPEFFKDTGLIELAVKYSTYPPTRWVHEESKLLDEVQISLGGEFHFDVNDYCADDHTTDLLLIAGGVGINPLLSIFRHVARQPIERDGVVETGIKLPKVLLLYCASSDENLIFKDEIAAEVSKCTNLNCEFIITSSERIEDDSKEIGPRMKHTTSRRLDKGSLERKLKINFGPKEHINTFVCGPNSMIDDVNTALLQIGLQNDKIKFEKWW